MRAVAPLLEQEPARSRLGEPLPGFLGRVTAEQKQQRLAADGAPQVPATLVQIVKVLPEDALTVEQWRALFASYPGGESLWEKRLDKLWRDSLPAGDLAVEAPDLENGKVALEQLLQASPPPVAISDEDDNSHSPTKPGGGEAKEKPFKDNLRILGALGAAQGNPSLQLGFKNSATFTSGPWEEKIKVAVLPGVVSARDGSFYSAEASLSHDLGKGYVFASGSWERDETLGIANEADIRAGYGRSLVENQRQKLTVEGGLGATWTAMLDATHAVVPTPGASFTYILHLLPHWSFIQAFESYGDLHDKSDWDLRSVTKVSRALSEKAAVFAAYSVMKLTQPTPGYAPTDARAMVGLKIKF